MAAQHRRIEFAPRRGDRQLYVQPLCLACGKPASKSCGRCAPETIAPYCSGECQQAHWREHAPHCSSADKRPCVYCGTARDPAAMHPCKICGALYCDAECAVRDWRGSRVTAAPVARKAHRSCCLAGRPDVFAADVKYALKMSERAVYFVSACSCPAKFAKFAKPLSRAVDPRLRNLGLAPIEVPQQCVAHASQSLQSSQTLQGLQNLRTLQTLQAACVEERLAQERAEIIDRYKEFTRENAFKHDCPADVSLVRRLWRVCLLLHNMLARTPRDVWDETHDELAHTLRCWARAGIAGARCASGGCARAAGGADTPVADTLASALTRCTTKSDLWKAYMAVSDERARAAATGAAVTRAAATGAAVTGAVATDAAESVADLHTAFTVLSELSD